MDEARVVQSGDAEVRLVQCVAPGPDPLFLVAIVMPITRDGRLDKRCNRLRARIPRSHPAPIFTMLRRDYRRQGQTGDGQGGCRSRHKPKCRSCSRVVSLHGEASSEATSCSAASLAQKGTTVAVPHLGGCSILHIWNAWTPTVTSMMYALGRFAVNAAMKNESRLVRAAPMQPRSHSVSRNATLGLYLIRPRQHRGNREGDLSQRRRAPSCVHGVADRVLNGGHGIAQGKTTVFARAHR